MLHVANEPHAERNRFVQSAVGEFRAIQFIVNLFFKKF